MSTAIVLTGISGLMLLAYFDRIGTPPKQNPHYFRPLRAWFRRYSTVIFYGSAAFIFAVIMRWIFRFLELGTLMGGV